MSTNPSYMDCSEVVRRLNTQIIQEYADFAVELETNVTLKSKDHEYHKQMHDLSSALCALINTSGGLILIKCKSHNSTQLENWTDSVKTRLKHICEDLYFSCVKLGEISDKKTLEIHVSRGNRLIAVHTNFYIREGPSSTEQRLVNLIPKASENKKEYPDNNKQEKWINHTYRQDAIEQNESSTLEFKNFKCAGVEQLIERITTGNDGKRIEKTLFAFANQKCGGTLIIGILDNTTTGKKTVEGQKLSQIDKIFLDEILFKDKFGKFMRRGMHGEARIWRNQDYIPRHGKEWKITFIPIKGAPVNESCYLIHIRMNYCSGGVYASMPEMYTVQNDGRIASVEYDIWQKCITSTPDLQQKYLHSIPEPPSQSTHHHQPATAHNQLPLLDGLEEYLPQLTGELRDWKRKNGENDPSASWKQHSGIWEEDRKLREKICDVPKVSELCNVEMLTPRSPISYFPPEDFLLKTDLDGSLKQALKYMTYHYQDKDAVAFAGTSLITLFPEICGISTPQSHALDIFVMRSDGTGGYGIDVWSIGHDAQYSDEHVSYQKSLLRQLKRLLLIRYVNIAVSMKGILKFHDQTRHLCIETLSSTGDQSLELHQKAVASVLLPGKMLKNRRGERYLVHLTKAQAERVLPISMARFSIVDGPPGSGKTLMAFTLIENLKKEKNLKSEQIKYICPSQALANYAKSQNLCLVSVFPGKKLMQMILKDIATGVCFFVFDDGHWNHCPHRQWTQLCGEVDKPNGPQVVIFQDSSFQNYGHQNDEMTSAVQEYERSHPHFSFSKNKSPPEMLRNSLPIFSFFKANAEKNGDWLESRQNVPGDDVRIHPHKGSDLQKINGDNPIIKTVSDRLKNDSSEHLYDESDIAILIGSFIFRRRDIIRSIENALKEVLHISVQRASEIPAKLMVVDSLRNFVGLDCKCCIVIMDEGSISDTKLKLFSVSRGILHVDFILIYDEDDKRDHSATAKMHISPENLWQKKSMELVHDLHRQLSCNERMSDNRESSFQQQVPETPKWKEFVLVLLDKQLHANEEEQRSNKKIQDCIKMMIPEAWHHELYKYQACRMVCEHPDDCISVACVLAFPKQYPHKTKELLDLSSGVIRSSQAAEAMTTAVKVILASLRTITKQDEQSGVQPISNTHLEVVLESLDDLITVLDDVDMRTAAMELGLVDVLLGIQKYFDKDVTVRQKVLEVFGRVMKDNTARTQAIDRGLVDDLLKILDQQDSDNQVKLRALDVLYKMKDVKVKTEEIVLNGLLGILKQKDIDNLVQHAMTVLQTVVMDKTMRTAAIQQGVVDVLLGIMKQQPNQDETVHLEVIQAVCTIKEHSTEMADEIDQGVIDSLLKILARCDNNQAEGDALDILHRVMKDSDDRSDDMQQQVVDGLLGIMKHPKKMASVKQKVLQIMKIVNEQSISRAEDIDQQMVGGLLKILMVHEKDNQVQLDALRVLHTVIEDSSVKSAAILPGVFDVLSRMMNHPEKDYVVKDKVLQVLKTLREKSTEWTEKINQGVVAGLLDLLRQHGDDNQVQRDALRVLESVIEDNSMKKVAIQEGVVELLLPVIKQHDKDDVVKLKVLQVLNTVKQDSATRTETIDQAVIDGLLEILKQHTSSNVLLQEDTLEVLHTAIEKSDLKKEAMQQGVVDVLLSVLKHPDKEDTVRLKVIEVLQTLENDSAARREEIDLGVVDILLDIIKQYDIDKWVQEDTLEVLRSAMKESGMRTALLQRGGTGILLNLIKQAERHVDVQVKTLKVIKKAIKKIDTRTAMLKEGALDMLIDLIKQSETHVEVSIQSIKVLCAAMNEDSTVKNEEIVTAVVDRLMKILRQRDTDKWVQFNALLAVNSALKDSDMRTALSQQEVVDILLGLLRKPDGDVKVQRRALLAVNSALKDSDLRAALSQQGLVDILLGLLRKPDGDAWVQGNALLAVKSALEDSDLRAALSQQGVADILLGLLRKPDGDAWVQVAALRAVKSALEDSDLRAALSQQGVVDILLGLLRKPDGDANVQSTALLAVDSALEDTDLRAALSQQGVVDILLGLLRKPDGDAWVQVRALIALNTMMEESDLRAALSQQGVLDILLGLLRKPDGDALVQVRALIALNTMIEESDMRAALSQQGVVDILLGLLRKPDGDTLLHQWALKALDTMLMDSDLRAALSQQGVVDILLGLLNRHDSDADVQRWVLRALDTAMRHSVSRAVLLEKGVLDVLLGFINQTTRDVTQGLVKKRMDLIKRAADIMCMSAPATEITHSDIQSMQSILHKFVHDHRDLPEAHEAITSVELVLTMLLKK